MNHSALLETLRKFDFYEIRNDVASRFEAVVRKEKMTELLRVLQEFYGKPYKPAGAHPDSQAKQLTSPYGGIQDNQILFHQADGASFSLSMIWPWSNGMMATLITVCGVKD